MKSMKWSVHLILLVVLCLVVGSRCEAAEPSSQWDSLLDVTYKFSWYPRADLQKLLEVKTSEYGQSLEDYRALKLTEVTGGRALTDQVRTDDFVTGLPWLDYYRLSMAEFCLFLATEQVSHLQNAQSALSVLAHKTEQPEIEFWYYMYGAHSASLVKDREAFVTEMYRLWQNVIIPMEVETRNFPMQSAQAGFVKNLPFLYENLVHLLFRKAILEQEISDLYALNVMILDIQPKLTVENGYKTMAEQVVERMRGPSSDNKNVNFAVALLEATAKRYDFEDEKDDAQLASKFFLALKYYNLANSWADTGKGRTAILTQYMGFMNYVLRRFSDPDDVLSSNQYFQNLPAMANDQMEMAFQAYNRLAAPAVENTNGLTEGFEDRKTYLQAMHQLLDSTAKLAIVLADFHKGNLSLDSRSTPMPRPVPWSTTATCLTAMRRPMLKSSRIMPISWPLMPPQNSLCSIASRPVSAPITGLLPLRLPTRCRRSKYSPSISPAFCRRLFSAPSMARCRSIFTPHAR